MSDQTEDEGLIRAIGPKVLGLNIVNMVVGGGIFVLPGLLAVQLGSAAILAYLVVSAAVALIFLCFAEVGSRITRSGGAYAYVEEAFGPFAGFIASTLLWFGWCVMSDAAITVAMVDTIAIAFPVLADPLPRALFIIVLFAFLAIANIRGVKSGVRLLVFNTIAKLVPLLLLIAVGLFVINFDNLAIPEWPTLEKVGAGALVLVFVFSGAESALSCSGEIKNPSKTVPKGLLLGLGGVLMLYIGLQTVAQGVLGAELAGNTEAPLAAAATVVFGNWGAKMLLIGGVISIYATVSGDLLNTPRVLFASARDGTLPGFLTKVHPKYKTPYVAIIVYAALIGGFALSGVFKPLAVLASGSILVVYIGVCLAVLRIRQRDGEPNAGEFRLPGGPVIPLLAVVINGWLLWQMTAEEAVGLLALIGFSVAYYGANFLIFRKRIMQS
ncbi:MAG: amino acid permease [Proteobacteria bacterium]|nr:amino acid permease [Pseudomonadota bacterium]MDA0992462.1 amino acid permease [Pseudomonadota bacterium]